MNSKLFKFIKEVTEDAGDNSGIIFIFYISLIIVSGFISLKLMYAIFFLGFFIILITVSYNIIIYLINKWRDLR